MFLTDKKLTNPILYEMIQEESERQLMKWGVQTHTPFEWLTYTTEELGELAQAISEHYYRDQPKENVIREAVQVVTLALKIAEMYMDEEVR